MRRTGWFVFISLVACTAGGGEGGGGSTSSATAASEASTTTTEPTSGTTATGSSTGPPGEEGTTGEPKSLCGVFCAKFAACEDPRAVDCDASCAEVESWFDYIGPVCAGLFDEYVVCTLGKTCAELAMNPGVCAEVVDGAAEIDVCTTDQCEAYADRGIECGFVVPEERASRAYECSVTLAQTVAVGPACTDAQEALITCQTTAACDEIGNGTACKAEADAADAACAA